MNGTRLRQNQSPLALLVFCLCGWSALSCSPSDSAEPLPTITTSGEECLEGQVACGEQCVALESDPNACGSCNEQCAADEVCDQGSCRSAALGCTEERVDCNRSCVDTEQSRQHCGQCDNECPSAAECLSSRCQCTDGGELCGDACVDLQSNLMHCGACGEACVGGQLCVEGSCECPEGRTQCGDECVDLSANDQHCGACDTACEGGQVCGESSCACPAEQVLCGDVCADTQTDSNHCGECGNSCVSTQVCELGECLCPEGQSLCGDECIDVLSDDQNCGGCGLSCGLGESCRTGVCSFGGAGEDSCQGLTEALSIREVIAYQTVRTQLVANGELAAEQGTRLVAGKDTLVRALVEPLEGFGARSVSARLFLENGEERSLLYSSSQPTIEQASTEDNRGSSLEFHVPGAQITEETRFALEVVDCAPADEEGEVALGEEPLADTALALLPDAGGPLVQEALPSRFPESDGADMGAVRTEALQLRLIPVDVNGRLPGTSEEELASFRNAIIQTYPVADAVITVGEPLAIDDPEDWETTLDLLRIRRQRDDVENSVYYYGMVRPTNTQQEFCNGACVAGVGYVVNNNDPRLRVSVGLAYSNSSSLFTMLHELGHNHGRGHSPCVFQGGNIQGVDQSFPHDGGATGVFGYFAGDDQLIPPNATDLMGYCNNQWVSDYTYNGLLNRSLVVNQSILQSRIADPARIGAFRVMYWDDRYGSRWSRGGDEQTEALGEAEVAVALDASGTPLTETTVYRTQIAGVGGYSYYVPAPRAGWAAIQIQGLAPVPY